MVEWEDYRLIYTSTLKDNKSLLFQRIGLQPLTGSVPRGGLELLLIHLRGPSVFGKTHKVKATYLDGV